jgi:hypothetical protein
MRMAQTEAKTAAESNVQVLSEIRNGLKNTREATRQASAVAQQTFNMGEEIRITAKEAVAVGKTTPSRGYCTPKYALVGPYEEDTFAGIRPGC